MILWFTQQRRAVHVPYYLLLTFPSFRIYHQVIVKIFSASTPVAYPIISYDLDIDGGMPG